MMMDLRQTLTLLLGFHIVLGGNGENQCDKSNVEVLNGIEFSPDPMTAMSASSESDTEHSADKGLALGRTGWSPADPRPGEWLEADLASWAYIRQVRVISLTPGLEVKVGVTVDFQDWKPADKITVKGKYIKAEFNPPVLAQFVRATVTKVTGDVEMEMIVIGCIRRRGVAEERKRSARSKPRTFGEYLAYSFTYITPLYEGSYNSSRYEGVSQWWKTGNVQLSSFV